MGGIMIEGKTTLAEPLFQDKQIKSLGGADNKVAQAIGDIGSQVVVPDLLVVLDHSDYTTRRGAVEALGALKSHDAVPALIQGLRDEIIRIQCVWALGTIGDARAIPALHDYLSDSRDESVRSRTILALSAHGDRGALPIIKQLLLNPEVVTEATTALVNMEGKNALPDLLTALEVIIFSRRDCRRSIGTILDAIDNLHDPSAIPSLLRLMKAIPPPRISGNIMYVYPKNDFAIKNISHVVNKLKKEEIEI